MTMTFRSAAGVLCLALLAGCQSAPSGLAQRPAPKPAEVALGLEGTLRLGEAALAGGDFSSAVRILGAAAETYPEDPRVRGSLADAYFVMGALPEAGQAYRELAVIEASSAAPLVGLGRVALARGEAEEAEKQFVAALALAPDDVAAMNGRAVALDLTGRHAQAQGLYDAILARDPTNRAVMTNRALSLALGGDPAAAVAELDELARAPLRLPQARHNLALAYALSGRIAPAREILRSELSRREADENLAFYRTISRTIAREGRT